MSKYQDFGLDEKKISRGPAEIHERFRCIWCDSDVQHGFNMCFSNWVICRDCVETAHFEDETHRWGKSEACFKCGSTDMNGFKGSEKNSFEISICNECIDWAKESFTKKEDFINNNREKMTTDEILKQCKIIGNNIKLPDVLLDYKTEYIPLKKKLEGIGGKWRGGKTEAFVFDSDPSELLADLQQGKQINLKKDFQFFPTPENLGMHLIGLSPISLTQPNIKVLEPSAGDGALIKCIHQIAPDLVVDCFELMDQNILKLQKIDNVNLIGKDFLTTAADRDYDLIIANPPFTNNQDIDHIRSMYDCLKVGGALVTIASRSWTFGEQKKQVEFREWLSSIGAYTEEIDAGKFKQSGTLVGTMIISLMKKVGSAEVREPMWTKDQVKSMNETVRTPMVLGLQDNETTTESLDLVLDEAKELMQTVENNKEVLKEGPNTKEETIEQSPDEIAADIEASIGKSLELIKSVRNNLNPEKVEEEMSFFKQMSEVLGQAELSLTIKPSGDRLTVMAFAKDSNIKPLVVTGTADELDEGFFGELSVPVAKITGLKSNASSIDGDTKTASPVKKSSRSKKSEASEVAELVEKAREEQADTEDEARKVKEAEEAAALEAENKRIAAEEEEKRKAEEERIKKFDELISKAEQLEETKEFKNAAITVKAAKEFSLNPEELDARVKELMQKHFDAEMEAI